MKEKVAEEKKPLLSIIMPCYNMETTLVRAIDSILMQKVDFEYEVIIVDDASTDKTLEISTAYAQNDKRIHVIKNKKNEGNAKSFYVGLCNARGDYFCVLDGDDFYTIKNKFQKQIEFFRQDKAEEFVAICHGYITSFGNGLVNVANVGKVTEFTYADYLNQRVDGYYHTSTYMFKNIFKGNVPELFAEECFRGDTPRTLIHLRFSNKKVKVLNFVGSVYSYTRKGIWTKLSKAGQMRRQIYFWQHFKKIVNTDYEKQCIEKIITYWNKRLETVPNDTVEAEYVKIGLNDVLLRVKEIAQKYAFAQLNYVLNSLYHSEYLDTLCESIGTIFRFEKPDCVQRSINSNNISIVLGRLALRGGGIIKEVEELFTIFSQYNIQVLGTNMYIEDVPKELIELWAKYPNVVIKCPTKECKDRLNYFYEVQKDFAPSKTYFYCSHDDPWAIALMQPREGINASFFSFDHGFILGISASQLDFIIAKRPMDYVLLKKKLGDRVKYIPSWHKEKDLGKMEYQPTSKNNNLTTATCTARYYKVNGAWPYRYIDYMVDMLKNSAITHYHIGPMPEEARTEVREKIREENISSDRFIHINWVENLSEFFLEKNIDLFIQPFPVVSYKTTLELLSCGIPTICFSGRNRLESVDFIYRDAIKWRTKDEFLSIILSMTSQKLEKHSRLSKEYYDNVHNFEKISMILQNNSSCTPPKEIINPIDNQLHDIKDHISVLGLDSEMKIMDNEFIARLRNA